MITVFRIGTCRIIASSAIEAVTSHFARAAQLGAEMRDSKDVVIARKVRVFVEGIPVVVWQPTDAWPETLAVGGDLGAHRPMLAPEAGCEMGASAPVRPIGDPEDFPGVSRSSPANAQCTTAT